MSKRVSIVRESAFGTVPPSPRFATLRDGRTIDFGQVDTRPDAGRFAHAAELLGRGAVLIYPNESGNLRATITERVAGSTMSARVEPVTMGVQADGRTFFVIGAPAGIEAGRVMLGRLHKPKGKARRKRT